MRKKRVKNDFLKEAFFAFAEVFLKLLLTPFFVPCVALLCSVFPRTFQKEGSRLLRELWELNNKETTEFLRDKESALCLLRLGK